MSEGSMPNLKFTERKKRAASDDKVNCPACAKELHLNSLGRHLANKHDVHRDGTPLTAAERESRKIERERRKAVKSILPVDVEPDDNPLVLSQSDVEVLRSMVRVTATGAAVAAEELLACDRAKSVENSDHSHAEVGNVSEVSVAQNLNVSDMFAINETAELNEDAVKDSDVEIVGDDEPGDPGSGTAGACVGGEASSGGQQQKTARVVLTTESRRRLRLAPRKDLTRMLQDDDYGISQYAVPMLLGNSDVYHLIRRHAGVSPTDLVEALGTRFGWGPPNVNALRRRMTAMLYSRMRTLDDIRSLMPTPHDFSPAAAVQFVRRVSELLQEEQRPDFAPFE